MDYSLMSFGSLKRFEPKFVVVNVTTGCNLRCVYCYADSCGTDVLFITPAIIERLFDQLFSLSRDAQHVVCCFHGGEPLLNMPLLREIVERLKKKDYYPQMELAIQTNGTLISNDIAAFLKDNFTSIGVSLDGPRDVNDRTRVKKNGSGSFDALCNGLRSLRDNGIKFGTLAVLTKYNVEYVVETLELCAEAGATTIAFEPLVPNGRGASCTGLCVDADEYWEQMKRAVDWVLSYNAQRESSRRVYVRDFITVARKILTQGSYNHLCADIPCGAGAHTIALDCNGDLYLCDSFYGNDDYIIGNIETDSLESILDNKLVSRFACRKAANIPECSECEYSKYCLKGCIADNILRFGSRGFYMKSRYCLYYKHLADYLLQLLSNDRVDPNLIAGSCG